jgi:ribose transport system ATP-binding protein
MSDSNLILEVKGLNKWFGATYANKNIDFQLRPGEVRGLAGENGSGKSTLLTQIAGIQPSDSGEMFLNGTPYKPRSPLDATSSGVAIVVQELGLVPNLPAGINVFLGNTKRFSRFAIRFNA